MKPLVLTLVMLFVVAATCQAAPAITAPPTITGDALLGYRLDAPDTLVEEATDADLTLTWERSTDAGVFVEIPEAHDTSYVPEVADVGRRLRVHVVVETAAGGDEAWSTPTAPVARDANAADSEEPLTAGAVAKAPVKLAQWVVTAGSSVAVIGQLPADQLHDAAHVELEATVAGHSTVVATLAADDYGHVSGDITPTVNAVAWLVLESDLGVTNRIRLGVVGVRPQIRLRLAATRDGLDARGRTMIRGLKVLPGSIVSPGMAGLRLCWVGILPGEQRGTAVCRSSERVLSGAAGILHGGCGTRGAWSKARWRLVYDPGTTDLAASPFLAAASVWVRPQLGRADAAATPDVANVLNSPNAPNVPNLPRACATLRAWT